MVRSTQRDARDTHHTVSAGILDALGRGFLIATAGVVAGALFGTAHLAAIGLWTLGVAAASGVGCMIGSALVRNAGCDRCEKRVARAPRAAHVRKGMTAVPAVEAAGDVAPEERWARRMVTMGQQREHGTGTGRGV
jgi:hypothetical protein